jgi:hypothetical protein
MLLMLSAYLGLSAMPSGEWLLLADSVEKVARDYGRIMIPFR